MIWFLSSIFFSGLRYYFLEEMEEDWLLFCIRMINIVLSFMISFMEKISVYDFLKLYNYLILIKGSEGRWIGNWCGISSIEDICFSDYGCNSTLHNIFWIQTQQRNTRIHKKVIKTFFDNYNNRNIHWMLLISVNF